MSEDQGKLTLEKEGGGVYLFAQGCKLLNLCSICFSVLGAFLSSEIKKSFHC